MVDCMGKMVKWLKWLFFCVLRVLCGLMEGLFYGGFRELLKLD
jgi:hypothetical protein